MDGLIARNPRQNGSNRLGVEDRSFHDWYRFVLAFPPHLVRDYVSRFGLRQGDRLLDPFCGTGTTLVEGKKLGCRVVGFEANPVPQLASKVKTDWQVVPRDVLGSAAEAAGLARQALDAGGPLKTLAPEAEALLLKHSICPLPLHKALVLKGVIDRASSGPLRDLALVALAKVLVESASNLHFGPEVGVRGRKLDVDVVGAWLSRMQIMAEDLETVPDHARAGEAIVHHHDAREMCAAVAPRSIDAVFTSPPYPNEKDYTRTTRLESVVLGFITSKPQLQQVKRSLVKSNTRGVYVTDDDSKWVASDSRIQSLCVEIERRRVELGKTSGFEKLYARVTALYFGGIVRQLTALKTLLKPGAMLGYVVGDQASYLQVMIRTGEIIAELAEGLGYEVCSLDLFRERFATATKAQLREEVVVLRWPG